MDRENPRSLKQLLHSGQLQTLGEEARRRREITDSVRALLDENEAAHLVSANLDQPGVVVLTMDSPVWAARIQSRSREVAGRRLKVKVSPRSE